MKYVIHTNGNDTNDDYELKIKPHIIFINRIVCGDNFLGFVVEKFKWINLVDYARLY